MKQRIIDLCKIGYGFWIITTSFMILGAVDSYVSLPYYKETNTTLTCPTGSWDSGNTYCNSKNELIHEQWCSKGLFDNKEYCLEGTTSDYFYIGHFDFGVLWIPFLIINSINGIALFIVLNNKYKPFAFRTCSGNILNERLKVGTDSK